MEKISSTMVIYKNIDEENTKFSTMSKPLVSNYLVKRLGVLIIGN